MKNRVFAAIVLTLALCAAAPAMATHWEIFTSAADCEGWYAEGGIVVRNTLESVEVTYLVQLWQDGMVVQEQSGQMTVMSANPYAADFAADGMWEGELCGDYMVTGTFDIMVDEEDTTRFLEAMFTCECPPDDDICHYTPGYWKNHPEAWPVGSLMLGDTMYTMAELMVIFDTPTRGDATIILAQHLIAAKLNVLNGADDSINDAIDGADELLAGDAPLYSKPKGDLKDAVLMYKDELCAYNEIGCPDDEPVMQVEKTAPRTLIVEDAADSDQSSWGAVKGLYR